MTEWDCSKYVIITMQRIVIWILKNLYIMLQKIDVAT